MPAERLTGAEVDALFSGGAVASPGAATAGGGSAPRPWARGSERCQRCGERCVFTVQYFDATGARTVSRWLCSWCYEEVAATC